MLRKGFGTARVMLAVAAIAIVGVTAYYIYNKNNISKNMDNNIGASADAPGRQPGSGDMLNHKPGEKIGDWTLESITGTSVKDVVATFSGTVILRGNTKAGGVNDDEPATYFAIFPEEKSKLPYLPEDPRDYFPRTLWLDNREAFLQKAQEEGINVGPDMDSSDRVLKIKATRFVTRADSNVNINLADHITFVEFVK